MRGITGIAILISTAVAGACATSAPDTILFNGKIFTADPAQPWTEALAIRGGHHRPGRSVNPPA